MRTKIATSILILVLAAIGITALMRTQTAPSAQPASLRSNQDAPSSLQTTVPPAPTSRPPASPPVGSNTKVVFDILAPAAKAGHPGPACRLAYELNRCRDIADLPRQASVLAKARNPKAVELATQMMDRVEQCDGVSPDQIGEAFRFQIIAARNGTPSDQRNLVREPALPVNDFVNQLDSWRDYRESAREYFDAALRRRNTDDLTLLLQITAPATARIPRPPFRVDDPVLFHALYNLAISQHVPLPPYLTHVAKTAQLSLSNATRREIADKFVALGSNWDMTQPPDASTHPPRTLGENCPSLQP